MAENSRIDDLRKRYHENPRRFFAPLANEYRKAGMLDRALLLCQKHVPDQPDNMNGLVVYGQSLFESGHTAEAQDPFERALKLDPENLIALRHLGDIARIGGDVPAAKRWYERVLELDRRNDDVLDLMQQMGFGDPAEETPATRPSTAASGLVSVASTVSVSGGVDLGMIDLDMPAPAAPRPPAQPAGPGRTVVINAQALADRDRRDADVADAPTQALEAVRPTVGEPEATPARPSKRASLLDINFDFSETGEASEYGFVDVSATSALPIEATAASDALIVETTGDVAPLGLEPTIAEAQAAPEPALPAGDFELADFSAQVSPLAGLQATEFDAPEPPSAPLPETPKARPKPRMTKADLSSLPLLADFGLEDDDPSASKPTPIITPSVTAEEFPSLDLPSVESASASASRPSRATPTFVTETMAALYVQQGHIGEAIGVYRQLVAQSPNDSGLRAKLGELERMQQAETLPAVAADFEMPEFDEPVDAEMPEPAAANAAMGDVSFGDIGLKGQGNPTPVVTPSVATGPSAREFFGGFARRAALAAAVVAAAVVSDNSEAHAEPVTAVSGSLSAWPLDALFGAAQDVRDLHVAEVLAGVATFEGPDGGTGFDALFAEQAPPARRAVPRASEMLKFDQFFAAPGTAAPALPADVAPDAPAAPGGDDLDEFHGWLQGLQK